MTTEERLEKLERELAASKRRNRRLWIVLVAILGGCALAWTFTKGIGTAWAQAEAKGEKVIRANRFVLEDGQGRERGKLEMTVDGPALRLSDEKGNTRAVLSIFENEPGLKLWDEKGKAIWSAP